MEEHSGSEDEAESESEDVFNLATQFLITYEIRIHTLSLIMDLLLMVNSPSSINQLDLPGWMVVTGVVQ